MIDSMVSLAFAVYSNKGAYALLLGSGISRASGIPTGWEVVLDLIRKVAKLQGEECEPDPAGWFRKKYGVGPDYSKLLDEIAKTPTERQQLLRGYFEPTEEERSQSLKLPNAAHRAIAQLVAAGFLRVIVTTNFDRLLEKALEEVGVTPTVISTADQLSGALPLTHSGATVIKLHGDYLDTRIKNTEEELAVYDTALDRILDRIFDEYGLIVSGWSGDWDIALRAAIDRCPNRRFTTYWGTRSPLSEKGGALAHRRQAVVVYSKDANHLFESLRQKVQALEDMSAPHPLSAKMAVATVKRYIVDPTAIIRLHDLVREETEKLFIEINAPAFGGVAQLDHKEEFRSRLEKYRMLCEKLLSIFVTLCHYGNEHIVNIVVASLQRIANSGQEIRSGTEYLLKLRRYPALLLLYGAGLASVSAQNFKAFAEILTRPRVKIASGNSVAICSLIMPNTVAEREFWKMLPDHDRWCFPGNEYLFKMLREPLRELLPSDDDYQVIFDRFEYLFGLVHADLNQRTREDGWSGPVGRFAWREESLLESDRISHQIDTELNNEGDDWPLLKAGLFGGSLDQAKHTKAKFDAFIRLIQGNRFF